MKNNAIYTPDKSKVSWIGISMGGIDEIHWNVVPLSYNLYDGVGGIAVFLHAYSKTFKDETYKSLCESVDATLEKHLNDILLMNKEFGVEFNSGGFTGECSLMYVFLILYEVTSKENYLENAKKLYKVVEDQTQADIKEVENDIIAGTAGTILTLLKMYDICGDEQYLKLAIKAGYEEHDDRSIFCTLTDQGVIVMELEPHDDSAWRNSFLSITGNSVLSDFLNNNGIYVDSVFLRDTIFIYGFCNPELNVRKIIITGPKGKTYECTLAKDNGLFFTKIDEESASGKTIQGLDDKGKVVVEDDHWTY